MDRDRFDKLEKYRIPLMNMGPYFGVFMASHAIPDSALVLHAGTGCKMKGSLHLPDLFHESSSQVCWTELSGIDIATQGFELIQDAVITAYTRRNPGLIAIACSSVVDMTGFDMKEAVERLRARVPCPIIYVPTSGFEGDMYAGIADFTFALIEQCKWDVSPHKNNINIIGYLFDRYELENVANIYELKRLLGMMGVEIQSLFFSGQPAARLLDAGRACGNVILPYAAAHAERIRDISRRDTVLTDLPIGMRATTMWIEKVALLLGLDQEAPDRLCRREMEKAGRLLDKAKRFLKGYKVAIAQSTPMAAALYSFLLEMETEIDSVVLLDRSAGGAEAFAACVERLTGTAPSPDLAVLENPSWERLFSPPFLAESRWENALVIAPYIEMSEEQRSRLKIVELGIPSLSKMFIYSIPYMGYNGAVALAQRMLDAIVGIH